MPDPFDAYQYLAHLRSRWRLPAAAVAFAAAVSLSISLLLPSKYTARVTLVIEPPAGSDPRVSTAVSQIYLESLKTYEHFASSDHLFSRAAEKFQLRGGRNRPLEGLKKEVLRVSIHRNTKILEIAATLRDPRQAHQLAAFIAGEAVELNRQTNRAADEEMAAETRKQLDQASLRLAAAESARNRSRQKPPTLEDLRADLEQLRESRLEVDRLALSADLSIAEQENASVPESAQSRERLRAAKTRAARLLLQAAEMDRRIDARQKALAARVASDESLAGEYEKALTAHQELEGRLREQMGSAGYRGERLRLLDPGVTPERPSSPNVPLHVLAAAAMGLILSLFYLTMEFGLQATKAESLRKSLRVAAKS